LDIIQGQNRQR